MEVITYQSPSGREVSICEECRRRLERERRWPRDKSGEYCTVSHGRHSGECDTHETH